MKQLNRDNQQKSIEKGKKQISQQQGMESVDDISTLHSMVPHLDNPAIPIAQRQAAVIQLSHIVGNQRMQHIIQTQHRKDNSLTHSTPIANAVQIQRQDDAVPVDIVEVPEHPGNISELVIDTLRTVRGCLMNFHTALENFETRISNESGEEAAPKDPAMIAMQQVGTFVLNQLRGQIASAIPGGNFVNSLVSLGQSIESAIQAERQRSTRATNRNAAANFIIDMRTLINNTAVDLERNMEEDKIAVRQRYDAAESEGHRNAIRFHQELINSQVNAMETGSLSPESIFTRIVESWINETDSPSGGDSRVWINIDRSWTVREAYLAAPFGSRLAEQLERQGGLNVRDLHVPRTVQWFPFYGEEGGGLIRCMADIDATSGQATNIRAMGVQSQRYLQEFVDLLGTQPIPEATHVTGSRVQ